ncbi:phosphoribosylamine--glycine ligase [Haliangium ochraceum]|uniref:Phosphoribosylamine--glycine ligase n=1 Tax=Haliangium ochraceum (strain DSM 14365 / JCM 11303 / SMP-2) TaxID=502025 RepID=D0LU43_HALO1|nr:phosphoribosylamine--glycine ligase [Haliangium ochraceum]ACY17407.1 phosphoribosylamine/glycine ligase [Haliangium ochraceum DSM 14365]
MKILVVGSGGREHALVWRLAQSGHTLLCAPGNPGIAAHARCLDIGVGDLAGLCATAVREAVDLVVVGPEAPLVAGLADSLRDAGVAVFGPGAAAAQLEGSKVFSKQFFARHGIRSAAFRVCSAMDEVDAALSQLAGAGVGVVVKADGLAAGKGVVVCSDAAQAREAARAMLEDGRFGDAGARILIEQRLRGRELSVMAITDGKRFEILAQAEDHKALLDGDHGPNTGGMGTVSPPSWLAGAHGEALMQRIADEVFAPTLRGLAAEQLDYRGVLYAGLMIDPEGEPWLLEYNCRFGDPETQPVLARLRGDLATWLAGAAAGALPEQAASWDPRPAVCVVAAAAGYPSTPRKGDPIAGLDGDFGDDVHVFHAGTRRREGELLTAGGRVLAVTALADELAAARARAYDALAGISFPGMQFRRDIGSRGATR